MLSGTELVIGRSPYCTLVLDHPTVSRVHASLRRVNGRIELSDLGSRNGTYVNGQRLDERPRIIEPGDEIFIGEVKLLLESVEARHFADSGTCEVLPYQAEADPVTEIRSTPPLPTTEELRRP